MNLSAIGQIAINVRDLDAAVDFYGGKLGLKLIGRFPPGLAFFDCEGVRLMVSGVSEGTSTGNSVLYFNVPDIQGAYEALRLRGGSSSPTSHTSSTHPPTTNCGCPSSMTLREIPWRSWTSVGTLLRERESGMSWPISVCHDLRGRRSLRLRQR